MAAVDSLTIASAGAYGDALDGLIGRDPAGAASSRSELVNVHRRQLVTRDDSAVLTLRWEAVRSGGELFPVLDADITLAPSGAHATLLLTGAYRPLLAIAGAGPERVRAQRLATTMMRSFLSRLRHGLVHPEQVRSPAREAGPGRAGQHEL